MVRGLTVGSSVPAPNPYFSLLSHSRGGASEPISTPAVLGYNMNTPNLFHKL